MSVICGLLLYQPTTKHRIIVPGDRTISEPSVIFGLLNIYIVWIYPTVWVNETAMYRLFLFIVRGVRTEQLILSMVFGLKMFLSVRGVRTKLALPVRGVRTKWVVSVRGVRTKWVVSVRGVRTKWVFPVSCVRTKYKLFPWGSDTLLKNVRGVDKYRSHCPDNINY